MRLTGRGCLRVFVWAAAIMLLIALSVWVWALFYFANTGWFVMEPGSSFTKILPVPTVKTFDDVRARDLSWLNLSGDKELPATLLFNRDTIWPKPANLPPGFDPEAVLQAAMNPGLGVRELHKEGITGKGVNVAIIDQPLYRDHPEFAGQIAAYHDVGCISQSSMHGPAVASLLVGTNCGTAPDARLYYVAAPSWTADAAFQAKALDWVVEQNASLPDGRKIRAVSVSAAPSGPGSPFTKNNAMWDEACKRAEKAGILIVDCESTQTRGFVGPCWYDANDAENVAKCTPGNRSVPVTRQPVPSLILAPIAPRTTAEEYVKGKCSYAYWGHAGLSWGIPYATGVMTMGWQLRPDLSGDQMKDLLFKSAYVRPDGWKIINPKEFIRLVKEVPAPAK